MYRRIISPAEGLGGWAGVRIVSVEFNELQFPLGIATFAITPAADATPLPSQGMLNAISEEIARREANRQPSRPTLSRITTHSSGPRGSLLL